MTDWKRKLAAWLHDPAEKALVLMRAPEGHEHETAATLRTRLGIGADDFDRRADWLASSTDRPNWPRPGDDRYPDWEQMHFSREAMLIHPLSGECLQLEPLAEDIGVQAGRRASFDHFERLTTGADLRRAFLACWRFAPEIGRWSADAGALWGMLPADSRTPDHSIWQHVDLVSALHTAIADGDEPALLAMSFGPVQGFIAQARSTSDLWAGSHLLARTVWAGVQVLAQELGPDALLFPALRGVPLVDAWLIEEGQLGADGRALLTQVEPALLKRSDDRNPLFAASLPNKLLAIVPARQAGALAERVGAAARAFAREEAMAAAEAVFERAGASLTDSARAQVCAQLEGFPEVYSSAARWPVPPGAAPLRPAADALRKALASMDPALAESGIFDPALWALLNKELPVDGFTFWRPNAGILYPGVHHLAERGLAAAKATRDFAPLVQHGFRCTQCGEREWLAAAREQLDIPPGQRRASVAGAVESSAETVWTKLAEQAPSLARPGEHLCALCASKRMWPSRFAREVAAVTGETNGAARRFVVSTHAMAVATAVERHLDRGTDPLEAASALAALDDALQGTRMETAVLPGSLVRRLRGNERLDRVARRLPALLEQVRNAEDDAEPLTAGGLHAGELRRKMEAAFGTRPEAYYALIMMDGDRMGAWLAGDDPAYRLRYRDSWHPRARSKIDEFARKQAALGHYAHAHRPSSPARHATISRALGDFATRLVRYVVEDCVKGRLLYSGGDDVLAMVAVDDLFDAMLLLRCAYSGLAVPAALGEARGIGRIGADGKRSGAGRLLLGRGFACLQDEGAGLRLMTLMGHTATASMGAVVAHHQAPLARVLRELRAAEQEAKSAGRDRFCIRVLKRGGGEVKLTIPWWPATAPAGAAAPAPLPPVEQSPLLVIAELRQVLSRAMLSRSGLFRVQLWLDALTDNVGDASDPLWRAQAAGSIAAQFRRAGVRREDHPVLDRLAHQLVAQIGDVQKSKHPRTALENLLAVGEFFARASRASTAAAVEPRAEERGA